MQYTPIPEYSRNCVKYIDFLILMTESERSRRRHIAQWAEDAMSTSVVNENISDIDAVEGEVRHFKGGV